MLLLPLPCGLLISNASAQPANDPVARLLPDQEFVMLIPADSTIDQLPVLKEMPNSDTVAQLVTGLFRESYMREAVKFYYLAQQLLVQKGDLKQFEPAYLLLSQNQGGFPRFGFYLLRGDSILDKSSAPFIELVKNNAGPEDHLGSMTQIYPHEMGHIIYHLLAKDTDTLIPAAVDIHYSTQTTDYQTAFNEGFAMHFENMARISEPDNDRRLSILTDFEEKKDFIRHKVDAYERDFSWPARMGLYRLGMLAWYQTYEDIKRFEWVSNNKIKYQNTSKIFPDPEKTLQYRNSGIQYESVLKVPQRSFATEGVIASFFSALMQSDALHYPVDSSMYAQYFGSGPSNTTIDPVVNQYMKIFYIINHHLDFTLTEKSQFLDFVAAYVDHFPDERDIILSIFKNACGYDYPIDPGKELWIMNKTHSHGILVMEQFGGITLPLYTFNLNAATEADLLTFPGIRNQDARLLVDHIRTSGPLPDYEALKTVPGIRPETVQILSDSKFDPELFKKTYDEGPPLSISSFINAGLIQFAKLSGIYGLVCIVLVIPIYFFRREDIKPLRILGIVLRYSLLLFVSVVAVVMTSFPLLYFLGGSVLILVVGVLLKKSPTQKLNYLLTSLPILVLLSYTLF